MTTYLLRVWLLSIPQREHFLRLNSDTSKQINIPNPTFASHGNIFYLICVLISNKVTSKINPKIPFLITYNKSYNFSIKKT